MPVTLSEYKRPPEDNGRGIWGSAVSGWAGGEEGLDFWIPELQRLGIKWFGVPDDECNSLPLCERLLAAGIFPLVRILRRDPGPNDSPEPNPGHLNAAEQETVRRLVAAGVLYFETNTEPNLAGHWKSRAIPADRDEAARLVALNWLFDAQVILELGGYPGLPAISAGGQMDLIGALVGLGRQEILIEGCWIALHNYPLNRPLDYPADPVNQLGAPVAPSEYDIGPLTEWAWWDLRLGRAASLDEINQFRAVGKNPGATILNDHACFREYEYYFGLAQKYLGRPIPMISTATGPLIGRRDDMRYPRITPERHARTTAALFDFMQRQAPDYYFAALPWLLTATEQTAHEAWYGNFWQDAFENGTRIKAPIPVHPVPGVLRTGQLPVISAVKQMSSVSRLAPPPPPTLPEPIVVSADVPISSPPPAPDAASPAEIQVRRHTVEKGDSLASLARRFQTTVTSIVMANNIADPSALVPGMELIIPEARPAPPPARRAVTRATRRETHYTIQPGDSLSTIAYRFDTTISAIVAANHLEDPNAFKVGDELLIPQPLTPAPPPPPKKRPAPPSRKRTADKPAAAPPPPPRPRGASQFDPRLTALGVGVSSAIVVPGVVYWKLIGAVYVDPAESKGEASLMCTVLDQNGDPVGGQRVLAEAFGTPESCYTDSQGCAALPIDATFLPEHGDVGPFTAWVDGLPSDRVTGLGRPREQAVCFRVTWQKVISNPGR